MNAARTILVGASLVLLQSCTQSSNGPQTSPTAEKTTPASPRSTPPPWVASDCPNSAPNPVTIPVSDQNKCISMGKYNTRTASVLTDKSWFASGCPAILSDAVVTDPKCTSTSAPQPFSQGDLMRIRRKGDNFSLTVWNESTDGESIKQLDLRPMPDPKNNNVAWLEGSDKNYTFIVYFTHENDPDIIKHYKIDVFYNDNQKCDDEKPAYSNSPNPDCIAGTGQGSSGGGSEPPPKH